MRRRWTALALAAVLAGCAHPAATRPAPPPAPAPVTVTAPPMDADPPALPPPTGVPPAPAAVVADDALTAFADHQLTAAAWFAALAPYLSAVARTAYAGTDPALVPVHRLTGPPTLEAQTSAYLATVEQPTDAGTYRILLSRRDDGGWQVERLDPPAGSK